MENKHFLKELGKIGFVFLLAMALCACNKTSAADTKADSNAESADGASMNTDSDSEDIKEEPKKVNAKSLYSSFMEGNEPVYFDLYLADNPETEDSYGFLEVERNKGYSISEFAEKVAAIYQYEGIEQFSMDEVKYAYIDCGNDNEPELAVLFDDITVYGSLNCELFLIKCIDNKLQVCAKRYYGYRSDMQLYTDGTAVYSGSSGASSSYYELMVFDSDCKDQFVYSRESIYGSYDIYVPNCDIDLYELSEKLDISNSIYFEAYSFAPLESFDNYDDYAAAFQYTYYPLDEYYEIIEDDSEEFYSSTSPYYMFVKAAGINFHKPAEMEQIVNDRAAEFGCENLSGKQEVKFTTFYHAGILIDEYSYNDEYAPPSITVENPSWEYYSCVSYDSKNLPITLTKSYEAANNIIDDEGWLEAINQPAFDREYKEDEYYYYYLSDYNNYAYTSIIVYSKYSGELVATLDMSEFASPPGLSADNAWLITEGISDVKYYGGILYVAINHNTYASSAPQNGYIVALDPSDDYKVIWKSQPLVSNSYNFQVIDNTVICGYGFTDEPDYLYLLDRYSGVQTGIYKLKSGPEYIFIVGDKLYVRTYNTNYVFDISYG